MKVPSESESVLHYAVLSLTMLCAIVFTVAYELNWNLLAWWPALGAYVITASAVLNRLRGRAGWSIILLGSVMLCRYVRLMRPGIPEWLSFLSVVAYVFALVWLWLPRYNKPDRTIWYASVGASLMILTTTFGLRWG